jgi:hypothetical protein
MPATFIKSVVLTILLLLQFKFTDVVFDYAKTLNLPIVIVFILSLVTLILGIFLYRNPVSLLIEKYQSFIEKKV